MIKALAHDQEGKAVVFLGITDKNVEKLREGMPIHVDLRDFNEELEARILIIHGATEEALEETLIGDGKVSVGTVTRDKPLSLRDELIASVDALLNVVERIDGLEDLVERTQKAVNLMR